MTLPDHVFILVRLHPNSILIQTAMLNAPGNHPTSTIDIYPLTLANWFAQTTIMAMMETGAVLILVLLSLHKPTTIQPTKDVWTNAPPIHLGIWAQ